MPRGYAIRVRRAVLLAAGRGTRLGPLTAETPKCLLRVAGRTLLDRQLEALASVGVDDVTVVAGFMAEDVIRHVGDRGRVIVNEHYTTTNSITSLHLAALHLRGNAFLLQNADVLYPVEMLRRMVTAREDNTCLIDPFRPFDAGEYHIELAERRVVRYSNSLPAERSVGRSAQLLRVCSSDSAAFLDRIEQLVSSGGAGGFPNQAYDVLMNGRGLWPVFTAGLPWWEIDTADDLDRCNSENVASERRTPKLPPAPVAPSLRSRLASFVRSPHLPWSLHWLPPTIGGLVRHPIRVGRSIRAYRNGSLSFGALDLIANGPHFLRLVLAEARRLGFEPFLLWGTLLGCVRDGRFITGDRDIDLGILDADVDRLPALRDYMKQRGFCVRIENSDKLSLMHPQHQELYIDIDVVRRRGDGWVITNRDVDPEKLFHYHFPADVFARTKRAQLGDGSMVHVPGDPECFLAAVYGDWLAPAGKVDFRYGPLNTEVELAYPPSERSPS